MIVDAFDRRPAARADHHESQAIGNSVINSELEKRRS
jgi:hypothetical protein